MSLIYGEYLVNVYFSDIPHTFIPHFTLHSAEKIRIEFSANYPLTAFRNPHSAKYPFPSRLESVPERHETCYDVVVMAISYFSPVTENVNNICVVNCNGCKEKKHRISGIKPINHCQKIIVIVIAGRV